MAHKFDIKRAKHLDNIVRRIVYPPVPILRRIGLREGDIVLDIGAGSGYFAFPAAAIVGNGKVYAVDTQAGMIDIIAKRAQKKQIANIETVLSTENNPCIPHNTATVAFMSFVLHEVENKKEMLANIHAALKEGGRIAIIEFKRNVRSFGPPNHERIGEDELKKLLEEAGFTDISIQSLRRSTYLATAVKA